MNGGPKWLAVLLLALLIGCSSRPPYRPVAADPDAAYEMRSSRLSALDDWELIGRLALDDGTDGGSGRLQWRTQQLTSQLDFRGALGRGVWRLVIGPDGALLERADGSSSRAATVDQLVRQELGWRVPVRSLQWWVLGLLAPGPFSALDLDEDGLVRRFEQGGWTIEYERYQDVGGIEMPRKLRAVSGAYRVKLAVSQWTLEAAAPDGG